METTYAQTPINPYIDLVNKDGSRMEQSASPSQIASETMALEDEVRSIKAHVIKLYERLAPILRSVGVSAEKAPRKQPETPLATQLRIIADVAREAKEGLEAIQQGLDL